MLRGERQRRREEEIRAGARRSWRAMRERIERGTSTHGPLPGGLDVSRRAASWHESLSAEDPARLPMNSFEWVSLAALAVNEENRSEERRVGKECRSRRWPCQ